jgi:polysaccharide biosynthesis transport protein
MNMMNKEPSSTPAPAPRGLADVLGLTAAFQLLRRRTTLITIVGLSTLVAVFGFLILQTPVFSATALVMINAPPQSGGSVSGDASTTQAIDSEIELLRSPALLNELAAQLGLQASRNPAAPAEDVATNLAEAIEIERRGVTNIVEVTATSTDRLRAQVIANTYVDVYVNNQLNARVSNAGRENSALSQRLAELRTDVEEKERAAEDFRIETGLASSEDGGAPVVDYQGQLQQAQADLSERQARYRRLQELRTANAPTDSIATAVNSEALRGLQTREADIVARQTDLENRYLPNHPAVQAIRAERQDVESRIQREIQRASVELGDQVSAARARVQGMQSSLRSTTNDFANLANASTRLRELERAATESRELYESYLQRNQDLVDRASLAMADARILSYAGAPTAPSSPQLRIALALALAAGLLAGLLAGIAVEMFDQSVKNADDLETKVGHKAIASIPTISKRMMRQMPPAERHPSGYLVGRPMSAFTEALRVLRTVIVYSKLDFSVKVVAVTSALPNEGKTTISMCLARVAAMSGQRVCVVDCDLRMQSINDVVDIETDVGILQVLAGEAPWRSAIIRDPNSDAHILPVATAGFTPRDVFGSDAMAQLINDLRGHYDLVILDCAPILAVAETRILVSQADTTVLVARSGKTPVGALRAAAGQVEGAQGNVLGIALNCVLPHWQTYTDSLYFDQSKSYYSVS